MCRCSANEIQGQQSRGWSGQCPSPQRAEEIGWCGPTEVQGSERWVASNYKTLSKIAQSVFHPTYGLVILTTSHPTVVMAYCVKSLPDCSQPYLCLSYAWKFLPWAIEKLKHYRETYDVYVLSQNKDKGLIFWQNKNQRLFMETNI